MIRKDDDIYGPTCTMSIEKAKELTKRFEYTMKMMYENIKNTNTKTSTKPKNKKQKEN